MRQPRHRRFLYITVGTRYFELGYFELFAISNRIFQNFRSLDRNSTRYFELLKIEKKKVVTLEKKHASNTC